MTQEGFKRKLAAILSADVEGYSRLMGQDEAGTIHTLTVYKEAMVTLIKQYRGRVVDAPGDNLLADFVSVVHAVQCAVEIQQELAERNEGLPEDRFGTQPGRKSCPPTKAGSGIPMGRTVWCSAP